MPITKPKIPMDESWVVEGKESESLGSEGSWEEELKQEGRNTHYEAIPPPIVTPSRKSLPGPTRTRVSRRSERSPEPQFVMPPLDADTLEASWSESPRKTSRNAKDVRRRIRRQTDSEEREVVRPPKSRAPVITPGPNFMESVLDQSGVMFLHAFDILGRSLRLLKTPISILLALWLLFGMGYFARNLFISSLYSSVSPLCQLPGVSLLGLPFCPTGATRHDGMRSPVEFEQLMVVQSKFEDVLKESAGGVSLPMDMKRSEASIRDLRQLVTYSHLHSKNELLHEFDGFIDTSRVASYDLQKFNSHVGRAVDAVLATTRWTTRILDDMQKKQSSRGAIAAFADRVLAPFAPVQYDESALLNQYIQHTQSIEEEIHRLITEAQALLMVLTNLEDRLEIIHGVVTRDGDYAQAKKEEIMEQLWSYVGGNKGKLAKVDRQLGLLQQVGIYRKTAVAYVGGTMLRLEAIGAEIEGLRERLGAPELLRDRSNIPLSVHIENIRLGVERLEESRSNTKRLESENIRINLDRSQQSEGILIDG